VKDVPVHGRKRTRSLLGRWVDRSEPAGPALEGADE
jgi:hypothetical protein